MKTPGKPETDAAVSEQLPPRGIDAIVARFNAVMATTPKRSLVMCPYIQRE